MSIARIKVTSSRLFKTADNVEKRTNESKKIAGGIGKTLAAQSVFKRQSIAKRSNIYQKRKDGIRRREQRDLFQASKSTSSIGRIGKVVTNSTKGFLGRVLDAIALTMVGWALTNLPTIISLSKQLGERMSKMSGVLSSFMTNTFSILQEIGTLSGAFIRNLVAFDFDDMGKQVDNSLSKVLNSFNRMELDFANALRLLVEPFDFEITEEEQPPAPPPGTPTPDQQPPSTSSDRGNARSGTREQRALLDTLAMAEGTYKSGYSTWLGYRKHGPENLTNLTIDQVHELQGTFLRKYGALSAAVGRYQFVPLKSHAKRFGANTATQKFTPEFQDKLALFLAENRGVNTKEPIDSSDVLKLGKEWAAIPGGGYGQDRYSVSQILKMYSNLLKTTPATVAPPARTTPSPVQPGALGSRPLQTGDVLTQSIGRGVSDIRITDVMGSYRPGGRKHGGLDIAAPIGTWIALRLDCEWVGYGYDDYGYGHTLDVWVPELGVQLRFAHLLKKPNAFTKLKAGTSFAQVGSSGRSTAPHIHFEYTKTKGQIAGGSDADPSPYVPYILLTNKPNNAAFSVPGKGKATPARISGTNTAVTTSSNITPEKGEKTLVVAAPASMYQNPATMMGSSGGSPILVVGPSLNNLIKQRMLIELAYT